MCTLILLLSVKQIAVNNYIISYITSYHILYHIISYIYQSKCGVETRVRTEATAKNSLFADTVNTPGKF